MKAMNRVYLVDIRDELAVILKQEKAHQEFEYGYEAWKVWCKKNGFATSTFFNLVEKREWLTKFAAQSLCYYLKADYFWRCLRQ